MAIYGMDIDACYDQANRLCVIVDDLRAAQTKLDEVSKALVLVWTGGDADAPRRDLQREAKQLMRSAIVIEAAAQTITRTADQQRMTSSW